MFGLFKTILKNLLLKKFSRVVVVYCSVIKVLSLFFSSDSFYILSKAFLFVKNFFNFFQSYLVAFQQQAYLYYHKLFYLSRIFSILFLCRFSRISLNSLSFSFSLVKNFFILFRHFSVVFQLVKIPFLNSVLNKRRRRDLNPRAAINDLLPFQGSPFGQLGYFSKLPYLLSSSDIYLCRSQRQVILYLVSFMLSSTFLTFFQIFFSRFESKEKENKHSF